MPAPVPLLGMSFLAASVQARPLGEPLEIVEAEPDDALFGFVQSQLLPIDVLPVTLPRLLSLRALSKQ